MRCKLAMLTTVLLQEGCVNLQFEHKNDRLAELQMVESKAEKRDAKCHICLFIECYEHLLPHGKFSETERALPKISHIAGQIFHPCFQVIFIRNYIVRLRLMIGPQY